MGIFRMFFGIFTGIVGIFTRSRVIQNFVGFVLMVATVGTGLGFFFYHNPEFTPEPIAQLMRKIPGLENFQSRWNPNFPKTTDPDDNQNT
ncbi:MAG: hypothetical protein H7Y04_14090, partial [Verrucomicrobia bacterium]|nr:hypothetical protein [Cytophagales bacterium]